MSYFPWAQPARARPWFFPNRWGGIEGKILLWGGGCDERFGGGIKALPVSSPGSHTHTARQGILVDTGGDWLPGGSKQSRGEKQQLPKNKNNTKNLNLLEKTTIRISIRSWRNPKKKQVVGYTQPGQTDQTAGRKKQRFPLVHLHQEGVPQQAKQAEGQTTTHRVLMTWTGGLVVRAMVKLPYNYCLFEWLGIWAIILRPQNCP